MTSLINIFPDSTSPLKLLDACAGQAWELEENHRQNELKKPTSNLVQRQVFPHIFNGEDGVFEDDEFYRFFHFEDTLIYKDWGNSGTPQSFIGEAPFRFVNKLKEIEEKIRNIDPSLLGEKRSTKAWLFLRIIDCICAIFKRIFTANNTINALFCSRISLKCRLSDFKATFPDSCTILLKDPAKIQGIITAIFSEKPEADMLNYILENALPQIDMKSFTYSKETGDFTICYTRPHQYQASLNLQAISMGKVDLTVVCSARVAGNIDAFTKKISFNQGVGVNLIAFKDKKSLFFLKRKIAETIEDASQSDRPPILEFIQMPETGKIKVKGFVDLKIPDWLISPTLSYNTVKKNLSRVVWKPIELKA